MGTEGGGEVRAAPGQPNWERKHHDTTGNMIAVSHVLFFYLSKVYPNGYIAVGTQMGI
jgi:predicted secreted protein